MQSCVWKRIVVVLFLGLCVGNPGLAHLMQEPGPILPPGPEEPVPGKPGPEGKAEFKTPFLAGVTWFLAGRITDCMAAMEIPPAAVDAVFVFAEGKEPPFALEDLLMVILKVDGYEPYFVTEFTELRLGLFFLQLVYVIPLAPTICLVPIAKKGPCTHCMWEYVVGKSRTEPDGRVMVHVTIRHCEQGEWKVIFSGFLERLPRPPDGRCTPCTYRLQREELEFSTKDGTRFRVGRYVIHHCQDDGAFAPVWYEIPSVVGKPPEGKCTPGQLIIVRTAKEEDGKTVEIQTLFKCGASGTWEPLGSRTVK